MKVIYSEFPQNSISRVNMVVLPHSPKPLQPRDGDMTLPQKALLYYAQSEGAGLGYKPLLKDYQVQGQIRRYQLLKNSMPQDGQPLQDLFIESFEYGMRQKEQKIKQGAQPPSLMPEHIHNQMKDTAKLLVAKDEVVRREVVTTAENKMQLLVCNMEFLVCNAIREGRLHGQKVQKMQVLDKK